MRQFRLTLFVICAALVMSSAHAQINSGSIPIVGEVDKLQKTIVGTAILDMRDRNGKVVATFSFQTAPGKCSVYRLRGFDFCLRTKLDNLVVDRVEATTFPSLEFVDRVKGDRRPDYKAFNTVLSKIQVGPQTLFAGGIPVEDSQVGDNAIFSHATTLHKERLKVLWVFESSRTRRNWLQDSLPVIIRDCEADEASEALTDMARSGWEFTSMKDKKMFANAIAMQGLPGVTQDRGQDEREFDPGQGHKRDQQGTSSKTDVQMNDLDAQPVTFRLDGVNCVGATGVVKNQKLEIENGAPFKVAIIKVYADGKEKSLYDQTFQKAKARIPLDLKAGAVYRVEVRDVQSGKLLATIRLEAK